MPVCKAARIAATGIVAAAGVWQNGRAMRFGSIALAALLGTVAAPEAQALIAYSHDAVTVTSTTDSIPQDLPAQLYKPEGDGPFPAIVIQSIRSYAIRTDRRVSVHRADA